MDKADTSISYIVAFLLGIIVLAVAVYLLYKYINNPQFNCQQCSAELTSWCVKCYKIYGAAASDWGGAENTMDTKLSQCVVKCNLLSAALNNCGSEAFMHCKGYIPL